MKRIPLICVLVLTLVLPLSMAWADRYLVDTGTATKRTKRTVLVRPKSTPTKSGNALLNTLNDITKASSEKPYVLKIEPGVYDLGTSSLEMKPYVDIEGSGEIVTKITGNADGRGNGVVRGQSNCEIRFLTVENTGGGSNATAIYNWEASPKITNVTAKASSGSTSNLGVHNNQDSSPTMTNVTAIASGTGGSENIGVNNNANSSPTMTNITATGSGGSEGYGVFNHSSSSPTMTNVTAKASLGSYWNTGVDNAGNCSPTMIDVTAIASGLDAVANHGVRNGQNSSPIMANVVATASGGGWNVGVFNLESSSPTMNNVIASGSGGQTTGGVSNESNSSPTMNNVIATASGADEHNIGIGNDNSSPVMTNVTATALGETSRGVSNKDSSPIMTNVTAAALPDGSGMFNSGSSAITADRCSFKGGDLSIDTVNEDVTLHIGASNLDGDIYNVGTLHIGASKVDGDIYETTGATYKCVHCYDGSYNPVGEDCRPL